MIRDIEVRLYIESTSTKTPNEHYLELSYLINEFCTRLENERCSVYYKMYDGCNEPIKIKEH